jgi:hypothetical protein
MLNIFANSNYEIDIQTLMFLFGSATTTDSTEQNKPDEAAGTTQKSDPDYLYIAKVIQEVTSLSKVRNVMATASEKEWNQARENFLELVAHACTAFSVSTAMMPETLPLPRWFMFNGLVKTAFFSLPILLSMRQKGYGHWLDIAMTTLDEFDDFIENMLALGKEWSDLEEELKQLGNSSVTAY